MSLFVAVGVLMAFRPIREACWFAVVVWALALIPLGVDHVIHRGVLS